MHVSLKSLRTMTLAAALFTLAVGAVMATRGDGPVQAAALSQGAVESIAPLGEPAPNVVDCVFWSMPAVDEDEVATVDHRIESHQGGQTVALNASLGRMGTFEVSGSADGITVIGDNQARAALMQYEMNACLGTGTIEQAEYDALMQAAGQPPYEDCDASPGRGVHAASRLRTKEGSRGFEK